MFTARQQGDILFLGMDYPKSTVNVMTREAAKEIIDIFDQLNPDETRLVVFWSRKPHSFLNGAELLLTNHINNEQDLARLTEVTRAAYEKVANSPVPTVAAVDGNCFGCGMEFALCCDYRVASDSYDTQFYMTELADYHCLPIFGGLNRLPRLVGVKPATDLLLGAESWRAEKARQLGLVDEVLSSKNFAQDLMHYLSRLLEIGPSKRPSIPRAALAASEGCSANEYRAQVCEQIALLPPERQGLYSYCLDILLESLNENPTGAADVKSHVQPLAAKTSRSAGAFFFVRSMAKLASVGTTSSIPDREVILSLDPNGNNPFVKILMERKLRGLKIRHFTDSEAGAASFYLHDAVEEKGWPVEVVWGYQSDLRADLKASPVDRIYFPLKEEVPICEVFLKPESMAAFKPFLILLSHLGWHPLVVAAKSIDQPSPINRLIKIYLDYVNLFTMRGGKIEDLNHSLWTYGFERMPAGLHRMVIKKETVWSEDPMKGQNNPEILNGLFYSLYPEGLSLVKEGFLKHSSQMDLIMRLVFGYPLVRDHFTRVMEKSKAAPTSGGMEISIGKIDGEVKTSAWPAQSNKYEGK